MTVDQHEVAKAIWDSAIAGVKLMRRRKVKEVPHDNKETYKAYISKIRTSFIRESTLRERFSRKFKNEPDLITDIKFDKWIFEQLGKYSPYDKRMMFLIAQMVAHYLPKNLNFSYFDELEDDQQNKIYNHLKVINGLDLDLGVNTLTDVTKEDLKLAGTKTHEDIMHPASGKTENLEELLNGYMPNFFEDSFTQSEFENYEPKWESQYSSSKVPPRYENPASHMYNFNVNWEASDEHLLSEFKKWLYMRRPQCFETRGRKVKNKKSTHRIQDFRFWHVDNEGLKASDKMRLYREMYLESDKIRAIQSDNQLRNSSNAGLEFFELAIVGARYISSSGYASQPWSDNL